MRDRILGSVLIAAIALTSCRGDARPKAAEGPKPMPGDGAVAIALPVNYSFMSVDFKVGPGFEMNEMYADTGVFAATRFGVVRGRSALMRALAHQGNALHVTQFVRESVGRAINDRIVRDSGSYELVGQRGAGEHDLEPKGKYWTVWTYTPEGKWEIIADTLIGTGRSRSDLKPRPDLP